MEKNEKLEDPISVSLTEKTDETEQKEKIGAESSEENYPNLKERVTLEKEQFFSFKGKGMDFFKLYLVNMLFTILSLGIYSFWAKVKVTRYLFQNTEFMGEKFDYHATGKEKLIGFLKGAGIIILFLIIVNLVSFILTLPFGESKVIADSIIKGILSYIGFLFAFPLLAIGSHRFLLARTSYRNIRFNFSGDLPSNYPGLVKAAFLSVITLGIYSPWYMIKMSSFLYNNSGFGNEKFEFEAAPMELFKIYLKGILLTIVTFGIYNFWLQARLVQFFVKNTRFQGKEIECTLKGSQIFLTTIKFLALTLFTLGLGLPWGILMFARLYLNSISLKGEVDFNQIEGKYDQGASALADGISEAGEMLDSVAGIVS